MAAEIAFLVLGVGFLAITFAVFAMGNALETAERKRESAQSLLDEAYERELAWVEEQYRSIERIRRASKAGFTKERIIARRKKRA